jgi:hypothetical protein
LLRPFTISVSSFFAIPFTPPYFNSKISFPPLQTLSQVHFEMSAITYLDLETVDSILVE